MIPPIEAKTGAQLHVGGINAIFEDFGDAIAEKLPLFIGVVVLLSALLLMIVFRSVLVPLKAIADEPALDRRRLRHRSSPSSSGAGARA